MPRALITVNSLVELKGSELSTVEIAKSLLRMGWKVDIYTNLLGYPMSLEVNDLLFNSDFYVNSDPYEYFDPNYDLIWVQHSLLPESVIDHLVEFGQECAIVWHHMSFFAHIELPFNSEIENKLCDIHSFVSEETKHSLEKYGLKRPSVIFPNPAPLEFHVDFEANDSELKRLAIISNHPPQELLDFKNAYSNQVEIEIIGEKTVSKKVTPELLASFDAVVTIGKSVQYSLCLQRPVFIYDHFGGSGWVNQERIIEQQFHNFSGRDFPVKMTANEIAKELFTGYSNAKKFVDNNVEDFRYLYDLDRNLLSIISRFENTKLSRKKLDVAEGLQLKALLEQLRGLFRTLKYKESLLNEKNFPIPPTTVIEPISNRLTTSLLVVLLTEKSAANEIKRAQLSSKHQDSQFKNVVVIVQGCLNFELNPSDWVVDLEHSNVHLIRISNSFKELATFMNNILENNQDDFVAFSDGSVILHNDFISKAVPLITDSEAVFISFPRNRVIEEFAYDSWLEIGNESPEQNEELYKPLSPFKIWHSNLLGLSQSIYRRDELASKYKFKGHLDFAMFQEFLFRIQNQEMDIMITNRAKSLTLCTEFENMKVNNESSFSSREVEIILRQQIYKELGPPESLFFELIETDIQDATNLISQIVSRDSIDLGQNFPGLEARVINYIRRIPQRFRRFLLRNDK